ncbi:MAG TPA: SDR family NAD(P)-dependent oxidoreductase, partial [Noviherbaspirillum sp.]
MDQLNQSSGTSNGTSADNSLAGRTVLVTGGASGLGAALCHMLASSGANVVVGDLHPEKAEALARTLAETNGAVAERIHAIGFDVGDPAGAQQAIEQTISRFGTIDVLINNAGTDITLSMAELAPEQWLR